MIIKIILILLLSFILTGCGNNNTNNDLNNNIPQNNNANISNHLEIENIESDEDNNINSGEINNENNATIDDKNNFVEEIKDEIYGSKEDLNLASKDNSIARFTTPILTTDPNRYHNITLVRDKLNGYVLDNNETFSFNEVCGPYGESEGFKEATILLSNGKEDKGFGGGVCQLSTTLYNAVKNLDIEIIEKHSHSIPVAYVEKNQDATVSLQSNLDFKFKNISGKSLRFESSSTEKSLTVKVYSE